MRLKDLTEFFQKIVWIIVFGVNVFEILKVEISEKLLSQQRDQNPVFSRVEMLLMVA